MTVLHSAPATADLFSNNFKGNKSSLVTKIIKRRVTSCKEYTDPKLIEAAKIIDEVCGAGKLFNTLNGISSALDKLDSNGVATFNNGKEVDFNNILDALNKRITQAEIMMDRVNTLLDGLNIQGRIIYNKEKDNNNGDI